MRTLVWAAWATVLLGGCAGLTSRPLNDAANAADEGIRYFDTSPFLLIYTDGKGGLVSKLLYLPDSTKLRSIKPYAYAAKNDTTLKFDHGRLSQAKSVVDETAIPTTVISGLEKVAISRAKANAANNGGTGIPAPYLFRIVSDERGLWSLAGGPAVGADGKLPFTIRFKD